VLTSADSGRFFSDPLIDSARLALEDKLTVFYPLKASPNICALDYTLKWERPTSHLVFSQRVRHNV